MIKKIVFSTNPTSGGQTFRIQFTTKVNGEWDIYDIGNYIGTIGTTGVEFDKIIVEYSKSISAGLESLKNPFLFNGSSFSIPNGVGALTITFKEGLRVLSGINHGFYSTNLPKKVSIYDENGVLLHEGSELKGIGVSSASYATEFYATPELELMKVYPTNVIGTIETNDNSQVSNIYQIENIVTTQVVPENTDIKYLLSFDGRNTYKTYKNGSWVDVDISIKSNIMNQGMTKDEIEALTKNEFAMVITDNKTMDTLIGMTTGSEYSTPFISEVKVVYLRIVE